MVRLTRKPQLDFQIPDPHIGIVDPTNTSRPATGPPQAHVAESGAAAPQLHGEYGPFPASQTGQPQSSQRVAVEV